LKKGVSLHINYAVMMKATVFTPVQIHLLKMFELSNTEHALEELKNVLYKFYSEKMEAELDKLWDSGQLDQQRLDEINKMDLHKLEG